MTTLECFNLQMEVATTILSLFRSSIQPRVQEAGYFSFLPLLILITRGPKVDHLLQARFDYEIYIDYLLQIFLNG